MGKDPNVAFCAHYDTVHKEGGVQRVKDDGELLTAPDSDCLGADCTTGIYIIMQMISQGIPGVYIVFADEEVGCLGSNAMAQDLARSNGDHPLDSVDIMMSFDRFGNNSIITHQMGHRTASDEFAASLAAELEMPLKADPTGSYTDSNEFASLIPECTNVSVGYMNQHTAKEYQDISYLNELLYNLSYVEWDKLVVSRDHCLEEQLIVDQYEESEEEDLMEALVYENISDISTLLFQLGYTPSSIIDELQLEHPWYSQGMYYS